MRLCIRLWWCIRLRLVYEAVYVLNAMVADGWYMLLLLLLIHDDADTC
jgi:hypothetical protein